MKKAYFVSCVVVGGFFITSGVFNALAATIVMLLPRKEPWPTDPVVGFIGYLVICLIQVALGFWLVRMRNKSLPPVQQIPAAIGLFLMRLVGWWFYGVGLLTALAVLSAQFNPEVPFDRKLKSLAVGLILVAIIGSLGSFCLFFKRNWRSWRDLPANDELKRCAMQLGINFRPGITRGELSDLIRARRTGHRQPAMA